MEINEDQCWASVISRDEAQDGKFYYGVQTTGVYCRPSCKTPRLALRSNVKFYQTCTEAEQDGLRPCKRCHPQIDSGGSDTDRIAALCRYIEAHSDRTLTLEELSARANLSPSHLHRRFKAKVGVTPRQYWEACRSRALKDGLKNRGSVTDAIYDAGYGSASRVYESARTKLGMTPRQYCKGGKGLQISYASGETDLGMLMLGATDHGLCFVQFGETEAELFRLLEREYPKAWIAAMFESMHDDFAQWMTALKDHLKGAGLNLELPLDVQGTAFQIRVWRYLQTIPYGETQSYAEVAAGIGQPKSARAVAKACASNRMALLIPCHRVIRGDGSLGGYRWGIERKRSLLEQERRGTGKV